jgi:hypothetical protein
LKETNMSLEQFARKLLKNLWHNSTNKKK